MKIEKPLIETKKLCLGYSNADILLENLDLKIYSGEMIALMGKNGCGKSTLLKSLSNIIEPIDGEILLDGSNLLDISNKELSKIVSVVLTDKLTLSNMTVLEVVSLGRSPYTNFWGTLKNQDNEKIDEAINYVGLNDSKATMFETLSDGQKQKVMIAKALAQNPKILLMDEPTSFLDIQSKIEILAILKEVVKKKKISVLFSTHDWELVLEIANRVWIIDNAGKLFYGLPEDLILSGNVEDKFNLLNFSFEYESGRFLYDLRGTKPIFVIGEGDLREKWTKHSLAKEGHLFVLKEDNNTPKLIINPDSWELSYKDKCYNCNSLDYVLKWLDFLSESTS